MKKKHIACVSFGKDSLAMLMLIKEKNLPLDEIVFFDTGMEFDVIYNYRDICQSIFALVGIPLTTLRPQRPFLESMLTYSHKKKDGNIRVGYGWCGGLCRWGTTEKLRAMNNYCKDSIVYVGIAYDETERLKRLENTNKISPLAKYKMTENDCLNYCYRHGFTYDGLYEILDRLSCWCCRNKNLKELANYKKYLPNYFKRLCDLEKAIGEPMKKPLYLAERFGGDKNANE